MTRGSPVRLDFPSSLDLLDLVQGVSDRMGRAAGLDDEALHWLNVAVREPVLVKVLTPVICPPPPNV